MENAATTFQAQAVRVGATVHQTTHSEASVRAVEIFRQERCRVVAVASALPHRAAFVEVVRRAGLDEVPPTNLWPTRRADGGVSFATLGVAETGSALLHSTAEDRRVELCVDVHLILMDAATVVSTLDVAFGALRDISARPPAYATLVSGPSRSADIERQITIGVHGPRAVHVLLLET